MPRLLVLLLVLITGSAAAQKRNAGFADAPAPWRAYLEAAQAAERIADPLQRCLAYPDLPGVEWPQGHSRDHCLSHAPPSLPAAEFERLLDEGDYDLIERRLDGSLARHFAKVGRSEEIDYLFDVFAAATPNTDARTRAWVQARPASAHAHLARGVHLLNAGIDARGGKFIRETPPEQLRRMDALFAQALPELKRAVQLQPRLMPAHAWLLLASMYDGSVADAQGIVAEARRHDADCQTMFFRRMNALRPRWGGSYEDMLALAGEIAPRVAAHPQLAIYRSRPYAERARMLIADGQLDRQTVELLDIATRISSDEDSLEEAANLAYNATDAEPDSWKGLAYLLQQARFVDGGAWANRVLAQQLMRRAPAMAERFARQAQLQAGEDKADAARYYLAATLYNLGKFEEAQSHYLQVTHPDYRRTALRELVTMWQYDAGLERKAGAQRARPFLERLLREYPDDGRAHLYKLEGDAAIDGKVRAEALQAFIARADRNDPVQARAAKEMQRALDAMKPAGKP